MGGGNLQTADLTEGKHYRAVDAAKKKNHTHTLLKTIWVNIATIKTRVFKRSSSACWNSGWLEPRHSSNLCHLQAL